MAGIDRLHSAAEERPPRPIHGSPHPQQWLLDGDRIGLVDFDRLTLGDPELEVAVFQAEMDFERTAVARDAVNEAFRHGYESIAGALEPAGWPPTAPSSGSSRRAARPGPCAPTATRAPRATWRAPPRSSRMGHDA